MDNTNSQATNTEVSANTASVQNTVPAQPVNATAVQPQVQVNAALNSASVQSQQPVAPVQQPVQQPVTPVQPLQVGPVPVQQPQQVSPTPVAPVTPEQPAQPQVAQPQPSIVNPVPPIPPMVEVAPMPVTPTQEEVISTHKKTHSNTILFIIVIILIVFVLFMDNILDFVDKNIINKVPNNQNTSENLLNGFLKIEDKTGYLKVNNIKFYNVKRGNGTNIILNYEPYKTTSKIEEEGIYIELYNADKEIIDKKQFTVDKIEKDVVRTYTYEVTNDVYADAFYALVKTYTDKELSSTKTLTCKYEVNDDNITLNYVSTFEFTNNSLTKYNINKEFSYKEENETVNNYKEELKKEYLNITDYNIQSEYNDTLLKYNIDLNNEIKDFKPLYKKDTIITIVKNKEELKKWKCE